MSNAPASPLWRRVAAVLLAGYWLAMFVGTHVPHLRHGPSGTYLDKFYHFAAFLGLAVLLSLSLGLGGRVGLRAWAAISLGLACYGIFDELTQMLVDRDCELLDFLADVLGASLGSGLTIWGLAAWRRSSMAPAPVDGQR